MKESIFILKKGDALSFTRKNVYSGYFFDLDKDTNFNIRMYESTNELEFEIKGKYSLTKFYADKVTLNGTELTPKLLFLGEKENE